jgi:hypothetical protein
MTWSVVPVVVIGAAAVTVVDVPVPQEPAVSPQVGAAAVDQHA